MSTQTANTPKPEAKVRPIIQVTLIIISLSIIWFCLYKRLNKFKTSDPKPPIIFVTPETYKNFGGFPDTVKIGLYINQFREFNIVSNKFDFNGIIWFEFDPDVISLEILEKFVFKKGEIKQKSDPDTQLIDGKLLVRYNIRVAFSSPLNYAAFPLDNHTLNLTVINHFVSPSEILFSSSNREFIIKAKTESDGWTRVNQSVATGFEKSEIDPYDDRKTSYNPIAIFSIDYARYGIRYVLSIMMPLLLIFYLTLFSFSWGASGGLSLAIGGVTATLGYRFVIENLSPKTGYFMLSDHIFFLFLTANAIAFFINLIDLYAKKLSWQEKYASLIGLHVTVIFSCIYLFLFLE
jgi:hypothetical protein